MAWKGSPSALKPQIIWLRYSFYTINLLLMHILHHGLLLLHGTNAVHKVKLCSINTHSQPQSQSLAHREGVECFGLDRLPGLYGPSALRSLGSTLPHLLPPSIPSCATTWVRQGSGHNDNIIQENEIWMSSLLWLEGSESWKAGIAFLCFFSLNILSLNSFFWASTMHKSLGVRGKGTESRDNLDLY